MPGVAVLHAALRERGPAVLPAVHDRRARGWGSSLDPAHAASKRQTRSLSKKQTNNNSGLF